jgi:hypothetical protein
MKEWRALCILMQMLKCSACLKNCLCFNDVHSVPVVFVNIIFASGQTSKDEDREGI